MMRLSNLREHANGEVKHRLIWGKSKFHRRSHQTITSSGHAPEPLKFLRQHTPWKVDVSVA